MNPRAPDFTAVFLVDVTEGTVRTVTEPGREPVTWKQAHRSLYVTPVKGGFVVRSVVVRTSGDRVERLDKLIIDLPVAFSEAVVLCTRAKTVVDERVRGQQRPR